MKEKIYNSILQKKGLNLTEEENTAFKELVDFFDACIEKHDVTDVDKTVAYQYGNLCEEGIIQNEENKKLAFATFIFYVLEEADGEIDSLIDYPFCYPYIYDGLDSGLLGDHMSRYYCPTEDEDKYYDLTYYWNDAVLRAGIWGVCGGFRLVNSLIRLDVARLMLSYVCMKKDGGHFDLIKAAKCLLSYHRDHLCQKHGANDVWDNYYKLYSLLEEASDSKVQGINYYLAYMNTFGIGCDINYEKAKEYINKEESLYNECSNIDENGSSVAGTSEYYHMCWDLEEEIITCESETNEIKRVNDKLEIGDIVQYGTYDDRKVLWKVIGLEEGRALLLSTQAIESTYIANECPRISNKSKFKIIDFVKSMDIFNECYDDNGFTKEQIIYDEEHILKLNKKMGPIFLLSKEEIKKYIPNKEDRQCRVRYQAEINGYDNSGVSVEDGVCDMWATRTEKREDDRYVCVDSYGDFCDCSKLWATIGIRPAIWIKQ